MTATQFLAMLEAVDGCRTLADLAAHDRLFPRTVPDTALRAVLAEAVARRTRELADDAAVAAYVAEGGALPAPRPLTAPLVARLAQLIGSAASSAEVEAIDTRLRALYADDPGLGDLRFPVARARARSARCGSCAHGTTPNP
jgi:hypothetical protein